MAHPDCDHTDPIEFSNPEQGEIESSEDERFVSIAWCPKCGALERRWHAEGGIESDALRPYRLEG